MFGGRRTRRTRVAPRATGRHTHHTSAHHGHTTAAPPPRSGGGFFSRRRRQPVVVQQRKPSMKDKVSGALMRLRGSLTGRPGVKGAGTRRAHGTDGRGSRRTRRSMI